MGSRLTAVLPQAVAGAAHGLERLAPERPVDLLAQVADVDVDDVRAVLVSEVPGVLEQLEAGQHLARPPHERLEQGELLRREVDLVLAAPGAPRGRVEPEVADLELGRPLDAAAPRERAQPREQLGEGEGLRQVVVRAGVEARDAILDGVARGQHQNRRPDTGVAERRQVSKPSQARQHDVEHDRVVGVRPAIQSASSPVAATSAAWPSSTRPRLNRLRHLQLVLDDQDAHGPHRATVR